MISSQNNTNATDLLTFLSCFPASEKNFTHTSIGYPKGSYNIPKDQIEKLYNLIEENFKQGKLAHLTEKPTNPSIIKIDLDFRFDYEESSRKYTINHIVDIVKLYHETIREYVDIPPNLINAFVFERQNPYRYKGNTKDDIQ